MLFCERRIGADCDGHLPGCFGVTPYVGPMSVTMLRHPLTRVRSAFHHNRAVPYATEEQLLMAKRTRTIAEYAAVPGVGNMQTKQMAGLFVSDPAVPTEEQIQRAIAHLDDIAFFGLQEHFDSSVCLFAMRYGGVPPDAAFQRTRVSTNYDPKTPMSADDVEAVLRYDAADVRLYEAALRIFKQRAAALNFELLEE